MFQFPGFALKTLCIQVMSTWFISRLIHAEASNNRSMSGGFPHSDIPGSKGALASPGLIAECHVLHRLLPPRHPPNALLALDPIQKTDDPSTGKTSRHGQGPHAFHLGQCCLTWKDMRHVERTRGSGRVRISASVFTMSKDLEKVQTNCPEGFSPVDVLNGESRCPGGDGGCGRTRTSDLTLIRRTL